MKTMTIRSIPDEVAAFIAKRAASEGRSLNATTVSILEEAAGLGTPLQKKRDLSWLAGTWANAEKQAFDEAVAESRKIDYEEWK